MDPEPQRKQELDLSLLGHAVSDLPQSPDDAELETFPNPERARAYWIRLRYDEFSSLCPVTGQPDTASLRLSYMPGTRCIETKSLKLYLQSFRNFAGFNEQIVNRIADDFIAAADPAQLHLTGEFAPRGGISLTVEVNHPEKDSAP